MVICISTDYARKVTVNFDGNLEGAINNKLDGFTPFFLYN